MIGSSHIGSKALIFRARNNRSLPMCQSSSIDNTLKKKEDNFKEKREQGLVQSNSKNKTNKSLYHLLNCKSYCWLQVTRNQAVSLYFRNTLTKSFYRVTKVLKKDQWCNWVVQRVPANHSGKISMMKTVGVYILNSKEDPR